MSKKLSMSFRTQEGKTTTMTVEEPKNDLSATKVKAFMDSTITMNPFDSKSGDMVAIKSAEIVTITEEVLL